MGFKNTLEIELFTIWLKFIFVSGEESYQTVCYRSHWLVPNSQARLKGKGKMLGLISLTAPSRPVPHPYIEAFEERVTIPIHEGGIPTDQAKDLAAQDQGFCSQAH